MFRSSGEELGRDTAAEQAPARRERDVRTYARRPPDPHESEPLHARERVRVEGVRRAHELERLVEAEAEHQALASARRVRKRLVLAGRALTAAERRDVRSQ